MAKQSDTQRYLVDHLGRKVVRARLEDELAAPTVTGVRSILSGHPAQNLTPERLARLLLEAEQGDMIRYLELAEEIEEKDAHYRSVLATRKLQVSGLDLVVEAASDEAGDIADADFVRDFLRANVLQQALFDILDAVGKGFSCCEILWECTEKTWLPSRILWRDPRWFAFDQIDGTTPLLIGEHGERLPLAPCKFIFHVHKSKSGLPCRGGIARAAAWNYLFKNFDLKAWMIFAEVYGHPLRLGKYDASATEEDKLTLLRAVRDDIERSDAAQLSATLNRDLIRPLVRFNRGERARYPELVVKRPNREDVNALVNNVATLLPAGLTVETSVMRDRLGLPEPAEGAEVLKARTPDPESAPAVSGGKREKKEEEEKEKETPADAPAKARARSEVGPEVGPEGATAPYDAVDDLAGELAGDWRPLLAPLSDPVLALAEACVDEQEFLARLPGLASGGNAEDLTESLARAIFAARLTGLSGESHE